jgi:hypothetical protein
VRNNWPYRAASKRLFPGTLPPSFIQRYFCWVSACTLVWLKIRDVQRLQHIRVGGELDELSSRLLQAENTLRKLARIYILLLQCLFICLPRSEDNVFRHCGQAVVLRSRLGRSCTRLMFNVFAHTLQTAGSCLAPLCTNCICRFKLRSELNAFSHSGQTAILPSCTCRI